MTCLQAIPRAYRRSDKCRQIVQLSAAITSILAVLVFTCVMLALHVNQRVEQDEFAVTINTLTQTFGAVREQGTYVFDVGERFIVFKKTLQDVDVDAVQCLSSDKIPIDLSVAVQYSFIRTALVPVVLRDFESRVGYLEYLRTLVISLIEQSCILFSAESFYSQRGAVFAAMQDTLVNGTAGQPVIIDSFQLRNIAFPTSFSAAITQKQLVQQAVITALNDRTTRIVAANTTGLVALRQAETLLLQANATSSVIANQARATREVQNALWAQRATFFAGVVRDLGLSNATALASYIRAEVLRGAQSPLVSIRAN